MFVREFIFFTGKLGLRMTQTGLIFIRVTPSIPESLFPQ
jgi:hypothetical protein